MNYVIIRRDKVKFIPTKFSCYAFLTNKTAKHNKIIDCNTTKLGTNVDSITKLCVGTEHLNIANTVEKINNVCNNVQYCKIFHY